MVIVDSSVLILLSRVGQLELLKSYFGKIIITQEIYTEIKKGEIGASEIENALNDWIKIENLKNSELIKSISELEGIAEADVSVLLLAKENNDILLSIDYGC